MSATELRQLAWLLSGAVAATAASAALFPEVGAGWLALPTIAAIAVATWRPDWVARVPRRVHMLAFPAIATWFVADLLLTKEVLAALVRLDLLLLLYRAGSPRRRREQLQLLLLGLFMIVVTGVLTVSLAFAVHVLAFAGGGLLLLLTLTLQTEGETTAADGAVPAWMRVEWRRLAGRVRAAWNWRAALGGTALFAGLVALAAALFWVMPRFQLENGLFLERFMTTTSRTGFSDTIRFGDVTAIRQDDGPALRVDVPDRREMPATPYWRMLVLDEYRGGTFRLSPGLRRAAFGPESQEMEVRGDGAANGADGAWTFYLEPGVSRFLPLPGGFGGLRFRELQRVRRSELLGIVALGEDPATMTAYRLENVRPGEVWPEARFGSARHEARTAALRRTMLRVSEPDRRELEQVLHAAGAASELGAEAFAERVGGWLRRRHAYSLSPRIPSGEGDPLVRWLASSEGGHCELFAGSFVLLARAAGWPARVVTGFRGGSWNGYSGNYTVRNSDAHAWCEIFDPAAGGWRRIDPTPGGELVDNGSGAATGEARQRVDRSWSARLDSLRVWWYRRIVNFDRNDQREAWRRWKEAAMRSGQRLRAWMERAAAEVGNWAREPWSLKRATFLMMAGLTAAAVLAGGYVWRRRRGRWWRDARRGVNPVRREAGRWLQRLGNGGSGRGGEMAEVIRELERLRYGPAQSWPEPRAVWRRARKAARRRR